MEGTWKYGILACPVGQTSHFFLRGQFHFFLDESYLISTPSLTSVNQLNITKSTAGGKSNKKKPDPRRASAGPDPLSDQPHT